MPIAEVEIDETLVRRLLRTLPVDLRDLATGPVTRVAQGWDNSVWRVGRSDAEEYAVRIPVRAAAAHVIEEATMWAAEMSEPLRDHGVHVPFPVFQGLRRSEIPWPWSLVEWVPGRLLIDTPVSARQPAATALGRSLPALHRPAPPGAPVNPARGVPLRQRRTYTENQEPGVREFLGDDVVDGLLEVITEAEAAPSWPGAPVWCHGDLHVGNLTLTDAHGLGIIDFDDVTCGDPAVDLRVLWLAFDGPTRDEATSVLEASGAYDSAVWTRARGWAASSFVFPVAADAQGREFFGAAIHHACDQLLG